MSENTLTRKELIKTVAYRQGLSIRKTRLIVETILNIIMGHFYRGGDQVSLHGFGVFKRRSRAAFEGRNPATNERLNVPARDSVCFKPSKDLRELLNR